MNVGSIKTALAACSLLLIAKQAVKEAIKAPAAKKK